MEFVPAPPRVWPRSAYQWRRPAAADRGAKLEDLASLEVVSEAPSEFDSISDKFSVQLVAKLHIFSRPQVLATLSNGKATNFVSALSRVGPHKLPELVGATCDLLQRALASLKCLGSQGSLRTVLLQLRDCTSPRGPAVTLFLLLAINWSWHLLSRRLATSLVRFPPRPSGRAGERLDQRPID